MQKKWEGCQEIESIGDYRFKSCMPWQNAELLSTGRHPQFPKNLAGQKLSLKLPPTNINSKIVLRGSDY